MTTTMRRFLASALSLVVLAVTTATGCGRPHVKGTVAVDTILKAWGAGGLNTTAVVNIDDADTWNAGACSRGMVSGLDVLLCEYTNDETLADGEKRMIADWAEESVATGAVVRTSRTLLAIADRGKKDPEGRTIARLIKDFQAQH